MLMEIDEDIVHQSEEEGDFHCMISHEMEYSIDEGEGI